MKNLWSGTEFESTSTTSEFLLHTEIATVCVNTCACIFPYLCSLEGPRYKNTSVAMSTFNSLIFVSKYCSPLQENRGPQRIGIFHYSGREGRMSLETRKQENVSKVITGTCKKPQKSQLKGAPNCLIWDNFSISINNDINGL